MSSDVRTFLVGVGPTAAAALQSLAGRFTVAGLLRDAPRPGTFDDALDMAERAHVPVFDDLTLTGLRRAVDEVDPDMVVVSSYQRIVPGELLRGRPWVNVHYAPLPRYRGRAVVNWAIINGEDEAYVTIHSLVEGLDAGGVLAQRSVPIGPRDTVTDLYERLNAVQAALLPDAVSRRLSGDEGEPQDDARATYCCTRVPGDGLIDWSEPTAHTDRLIRSLTSPYPGAFTHLGLDRLVVHRAQPAANSGPWVGRVPGRVVRVDRQAGHVDVLTGDGALRLEQVAAADGRIVPATALISSLSSTLGLDAQQLLAELARLKEGLSP
jgi:methionyl-tRNA formyltransferase